MEIAGSALFWQFGRLSQYFYGFIRLERLRRAAKKIAVPDHRYPVIPIVRPGIRCDWQPLGKDPAPTTKFSLKLYVSSSDFEILNRN